MISKKRLAANLTLLLTAMIWGMGFVAQRAGMDYVGPFTFGATRFALGAIVLLPVIYYFDRGKKASLTDNSAMKSIDDDKESTPIIADEFDKNHTGWNKDLLIAGLSCGFILFIGSTFQQVGLVFTSAGKAAFITALYIVLVPLFGMFVHHKVGLNAWLGVVMATAGLFLLTITEHLTIAGGDLIVLVGAFFWALHILVIDYFLPKVDAIKLAFMQFAVASIICSIVMVFREQPSFSAMLSGAIPILYSGVLSAGAGFTLQIVGQKNTSPTVASLLLSMEAVFGAISGYLILDELLTSRELLGCILMFIAIVISQLPEKTVLKSSLS